VTKQVVKSAFDSMLTIAGKLWCSHGNTVSVLNATTLALEHQFNVEDERRLYLAAGGTSTWSVWIGCMNTLDLKLYHATKYTVLAEVNIKQHVSQKLTGLLHQLSNKYIQSSEFNIFLIF
jgi:hypothetical protein